MTDDQPIDYNEILAEATRIAKINLPETAQHVTDLREAFTDLADQNVSRFVHLMIRDARDESSDYFCELTSHEYSRRYDALSDVLVSMFYPVIMTAIIA